MSTKQLNSGNIRSAIDAIMAAARKHGEELAKTDSPIFPGVSAARITELSGFTYSGYPARYAVDGAACDAFWAARQVRK